MAIENTQLDSTCGDDRHNETPGLEALKADIIGEIEGIGAEMTSLLRAREVDVAQEFPTTTQVLACGGDCFMRRGNVSIVQGRPKAGKSFFCSMIAAAYLTGRYEDFATCDGQPGESLLYIDTEQCQEDVVALGRRIATMCGKLAAEAPATLHLLSIRRDGVEDARKVLGAAVRFYRPSLVILDGVTDLVHSPNDETESKDITMWLYNIAEAFGMHIMTVIHENQSILDKARGHIGSELERKCETAIQLVRDEDATGYRAEAKFRLTRKRSPRDFAFTITDQGLPVRHTIALAPAPENTPEPQKDGPASALEKMILMAYGQSKSLTYKTLCSNIIKAAGVQERAAKNRIKWASEMGLINKIGNMYHPCDKILRQQNITVQ